MTYVSPFHIISHFNEDETSFGESDLLRLQKKVLAEFNLQRTTTISVRGKEYSKDELLKLLDQVKSNEYPAHLAIYNVPGVLSFLESPKSKPNIEVIELFFEFNATAPFHEYLQETLTKSLYSHYKHFLSNKEFSILKESSALFRLITSDQEALFENLISTNLLEFISYVEEMTSIQNLHFGLQVELKRKLDFIFEDDYADFLNLLPSAFDDLIQHLTRALFNLMKHSDLHFAISSEYLLAIGTVITNINKRDPDLGWELSRFNTMLREKLRTLYVPDTPQIYVSRSVDRITGRKAMFRGWYITAALITSAYFLGDYPLIKQIVLSLAGILFLISFVLGATRE